MLRVGIKKKSLKKIIHWEYLQGFEGETDPFRLFKTFAQMSLTEFSIRNVSFWEGRRRKLWMGQVCWNSRNHPPRPQLGLLCDENYATLIVSSNMSCVVDRVEKAMYSFCFRFTLWNVWQNEGSKKKCSIMIWTNFDRKK